jgi:NAD(P)-dependent dehydrogenase (short-subunit alcohol dehydrogenase family)
MAMGNRLEGKIAVMTGSDSGMGYAMAVDLAKEGADVAMSYFHYQDGGL